MASLVTRALATLRDQGAGGLLARATRRIYRRRVLLILERHLGEGDEVPALPRHPFVVRFLESSELDLLAPHVTRARLADYRWRLVHGMKVTVFLTPDETECLAWLWSTDQPYYERYLNATFRAVPGSCLIIDGEVVSAERGRGVAFSAFPLVWPHWRARGCRVCVSPVESHNRPSLKVHARLSFREIERVDFHTLLGFQWSRPMSSRIGHGDETGHG